MDARALQALELPKVLDYLAGFAVSESGRQVCLNLCPFADIAHARSEAALLEQGRLWLLQTPFGLEPFAPLEGFLRYVERPSSVLDLEGLWELRRVLSQAGKMRSDMLAGETEGRWPLWVERCLSLPVPERSISGLSRCIGDDGHLRDEASPDLSLVRGELRRLHQQCSRKVKDYATEYNILHYLQDTFMTLSSDRYVLPLKSNFKGKLQGVVHDYSQTGETCYFEPMFLVEVNNKLQELKREEREEERKLLLFLSELVRDELPGVRSCYDFLVEIDLLRARHFLGQCYDGRLVEFDAERGVLLREAKHPLLALAGSEAARKALLALRLERQAEGAEVSVPVAVKVVPSTLELLPGQQALVISGGNAGGKTVALKTLGLIAAMSLCALPVPVEAGSVMPPWRDLYAFIGDEQSLDDHVSTFTAQISHLSRIWPELGPDSLIILDEFGAGTDPSQGAALAQAVVDCVMERGAYVLAATHFPALKAYALSTQGVRAASVLFDPKTRKPLFRLVYDQVGASQALDVAREHGLPEEILARAGQYLLLSGEDTSALVERLNSLAVEREAELASLEKEKRSFAEKRKKLEDRFEKEREQLFGKVQADARHILAEWKEQRISHKQALKELALARTSLIKNTEDAGEDGENARPAVDLASLHIRQRLRHIPWKRVGVLQEIDLRKQRVRLDLDGISLWADASDIALADDAISGIGKGKGGAKAEPARGFTGTAAGLLPLHLDLRGMRADVAVSELEKFLDGAILQGRSEVEVVHGRGTGVLRRELHVFLRGFPAVASFHLAPEDRGGDGMTLVELK